MKTASELKAELEALEGKAQPEEPEPPQSGSWLQRFAVQQDLSTIMNPEVPLARKVQMAHTVTDQYRREAYDPDYVITDEDRAIVEDVRSRIRQRRDGTFYLPGTVLV